MEQVGVRGNAILSEQGQAKKTSLYYSETECCVLQAAETAGAEPVADQSLCQCVPWGRTGGEDVQIQSFLTSLLRADRREFKTFRPSRKPKSQQKASTVVTAALSRVPPEDGSDPNCETLRGSQKQEEEGEFEITDLTLCVTSRLAVSGYSLTFQTHRSASKRRAARPKVQRHMP